MLAAADRDGLSVLAAAERNDRGVWAEHRVRLEAGVAPITTAPVVARVGRSPRQVRLRRLLGGCRVEAFDAAHAHRVGELLAASGTADVVDAHVVVTAAADSSPVLTADPDDPRVLAAQVPVPPDVGVLGAATTKARHRGLVRPQASRPSTDAGRAPPTRRTSARLAP